MLISSEEKQLFDEFIKITCLLDPDFLIGWDVQGGSLGFLAERASHLGIGLLKKISRTPTETKTASREFEVPEKRVTDEMLPEKLVDDAVLLEEAIIEDEWGRTHASGVHVGGRIVLNVWRLMRGEIKLNMYTAEAVAEAVLRRKIPSIHNRVLTKWFSSGSGRARYRSIEYIIQRAKLNFEIMNQLDMVSYNYLNGVLHMGGIQLLICWQFHCFLHFPFSFQFLHVDPSMISRKVCIS